MIEVKFVNITVIENVCDEGHGWQWRLESRDNNFEEFLCCRQVGWFLRKLMTTGTADLEYRLSEQEGTFTKVTSSMGRSTTYDMPTEGEFCPTKTLSGKPEYGRIFETSGGNMIQEMKYVDSDETAAVIKHRVEDNKLVMEMRCRDIVCRSVYKRMQ